MKSDPNELSTVDPQEATEARFGLTIPWRWLSVGLGMVTVAAVGTLIVVVSTNNIDTLSTIALALAVLAFAAQLIVSLAQGMAGAQQVAQVERVNTDTKAALAEIRATSEALLSTQRDQFGTVLAAALQRAVPEAVRETLVAQPVDGDETDAAGRNQEIQQAILFRVDQILAERARGGGSALAAPLPRRPTKTYRRLTTYPSSLEEAKDAVSVFKSLTPWEVHGLRMLGESAVRRTAAGEPLAFGSRAAEDGTFGPASEGLQKKGIVRPAEGLSPHGNPMYTFSPLGINVLSLLFGEGQPPKWLLDAMRD